MLFFCCGRSSKHSIEKHSAIPSWKHTSRSCNSYLLFWSRLFHCHLAQQFLEYVQSKHINNSLFQRHILSTHRKHSTTQRVINQVVLLKMVMDTSSSTSSVSEHLHADEEKVLSDFETQQNQNNMPVSKVRTAQDWDGIDDPENPLNWPVWKKVYHITMVGLLCFTM